MHCLGDRKHILIKQTKKDKRTDEELAKQLIIAEVIDEHREVLIELVEDKPVLWDPTNTDYPSLGKKQAYWLSIDNTFIETS
uniref:MADF domain-containing protein n=1 Tax=Ditylenchus dipsaci TaxID=166011 RepID=A0A915DZP2_9BILA